MNFHPPRLKLPPFRFEAGLDHNIAPPVIPAGCRNPGPGTVNLSIGLEFAILALGPGIRPGRQLNRLMIKAFEAPSLAPLAKVKGLQQSVGL